MWLHGSRTTFAAFRSLFQSCSVRDLSTSWSQQLWIIAAIIVILALRRMEMVLKPQFFAEDATVFFKIAYQQPWYESLFVPFHAGYYQLLQRALSEILLLAPLRWTPALFCWASTLVAAIVCSLIALPHFRHIVASDSARVLLAFLFALAPNAEAIGKLGYLQWYLQAWLYLTSVMIMPKSRASQVVLGLTIVVAQWSFALSFVVLPVWTLREILASRSTSKAVSSIIILSGLTQSAVQTLNARSTLGLPPADSVMALVHGTVNGLAAKVVGSLAIGEWASTRLLATLGWTPIYLLTAATVAAIGWRWRREVPTIRALIVLLIYLGGAGVAASALRPQYMLSFVATEYIAGHDRYFWSASLMLMTIIAALWPRTPRRMTAWPLAIWLLFQTPTLREVWTPYDYDWPSWAARLECPQHGCEPTKLSVPINPAGWRMVITAR